MAKRRNLAPTSHQEQFDAALGRLIREWEGRGFLVRVQATLSLPPRHYQYGGNAPTTRNPNPDPKYQTGGFARAAKLTGARRREIAQKAARARWKKS
jgi:hypothetical protein